MYCREERSGRYGSKITESDIDTIVCLDGMEVVGAFLAELLSESSRIAKNRGTNIASS